MEQLAPTLEVVLYVAYAVLGYQLLKLKGYTGAWYISLLVSGMPWFWFVFGFIKAKEQSPKTKMWSYIALLWAVTNLFFIAYVQGSK